MKLISYLDNTVANALLKEQANNPRKLELHGRLSGSILGSPLQEQVLHIIGVPQKDNDAYALRKFQRGHHVEAWIMSIMEGLVETQDELTYRGATGHIDAMVDMAKWDMPELGIIPHEIKSITNANFKWKLKMPTASYHHKLQACMYAMAKKADHYMIHYVASDDYRIMSMLYETKEMASEVDRIIDEVAEALKAGYVPSFEAREDWQNKPDYQKYPNWVELTPQEAMEKLEKEYPTAYQRLMDLAGK